MSWIVCQLGAREHYAIPRALHQTQQLQYLITDAWVPPQSWFNRLPGLTSLCDRYHPDLADAHVKSFTSPLLQFEALHRIKSFTPWETMIARNQWFQQRVIQFLNSSSMQSNEQPVLFSYSYAALELFRYAKRQGWTTILGQIDPGIGEERIVAKEHRKYPTLAPEWETAPPNYWQQWRQECELADVILVNSRWSKHLLEKENIAPHKMSVIPLSYTLSADAQSFQRTYPDCFTSHRPLRVLFLGLVTLRKGIASLLEAIQMLDDLPVEFWIVGPQQIHVPSKLRTHPQIRWMGSVPRSQVDTYYQQSDIFLFPTLSDGFGLTQLEAMSWKLPVLASQNCGDVVKHNFNGRILETVTGEAIATEINRILKQPEQLKVFAQHTYNAFDQFSSLTLQNHLNNLDINYQKLNV
ncbi:MAG: glycosyltransferase family 4 protein [Leptolyngbyaceae bacterium]|nr:glycosyltransferase family 4 protein [Leptolyngbyaceae bacterium]